MSVSATEEPAVPTEAAVAVGAGSHFLAGPGAARGSRQPSLRVRGHGSSWFHGFPLGFPGGLVPELGSVVRVVGVSTSQALLRGTSR